MKIYENSTIFEQYGMGIALCAANNIEEAKDMLNRSLQYDCFDPTDLTEFPNVIYTGDTPCILYINRYIE